MANGKIFKKMNYKLKKISGDASFREFYRIQKDKKSTIIVFAKKDKYKNLIVYSAVNKILNQNKILAPKLISNFIKNNMMEISDLGKISFFDFIKKKKDKTKEYEKVIDLIIKIQKIKLKSNYKYNKKNIKFKRYSISQLHKESDLFFDWYLKSIIPKKKLIKVKFKIKKELNNIYKKLYLKNTYFTHRDFHASNIMIDNKKLGIIDSQDAIIGNPLYDVASLIDDVRIKLPKVLQNNLLKYYMFKSKFKIKDQPYLKNDFDILSIQRNFKILGIFVRLHIRDKKSNYLKYLPYTWTLIERRIKNPIFNNLNILLKKYLPSKDIKHYED